MLWKTRTTQTLLPLLLAAAACSRDTVDDKDVNQDKIHARYVTTYEAGSGEQRHFAQLRMGGETGTTIRLTAPAKLEAQGEELRLHDGAEGLNLVGTYYFTGGAVRDPIPVVRFRWTRNDGEVSEHDVPLPPSVRVVEPEAGRSVSVAEPLNVTLETALPLDRDTLSVSLHGGDPEVGIRATPVPDAPGRYVFSPDDLRKLVASEATLEVSRTRRTVFPERQGYGDGEWKAAKVVVAIGEFQ